MEDVSWGECTDALERVLDPVPQVHRPLHHRRRVLRGLARLLDRRFEFTCRERGIIDCHRELSSTTGDRVDASRGDICAERKICRVRRTCGLPPRWEGCSEPTRKERVHMPHAIDSLDDDHRGAD